MSSASLHIPVMLQEMLECLHPRRGGLYADVTYGCGGYAAAIYTQSDRRLFAADRDPEALARGLIDPCVEIHHLRFGELHAHFAKHGLVFDGIVADLGVCSTQVDNPARGFAFNYDGPLSMEMGRGEQSALELIQRASVTELQEIFQVYGEERRSKTLAQIVFDARDQLRSTLDLARLIADRVGRTGRTHPATQVFQALRIAVNSELEELDALLRHAQHWLNPGGRLVITTFHSLEDRMVKRAVRGWAVSGRAVVGRAEVTLNPRARSAKIRWGQL